MYGPAIMANPVYVYKTLNSEIYFLKNYFWYDWYTGKVESKGG